MNEKNINKMEENFSINVLSDEIFTAEEPLCNEELIEKTSSLEEKYKGEVRLIRHVCYLPILIKNGDNQ